MSEATILAQVRNALGRRSDVRLFRNSSGYDEARKIHYGIPARGGADLLGWRSIVIGPEHLGSRMAIFCALEIKSDSGRTSAEQANFLRVVREAGGVAGVARSVDDALRIIGVTPCP